MEKMEMELITALEIAQKEQRKAYEQLEHALISSKETISQNRSATRKVKRSAAVC